MLALCLMLPAVVLMTPSVGCACICFAGCLALLKDSGCLQLAFWKIDLLVMQLGLGPNAADLETISMVPASQGRGTFCKGVLEDLQFWKMQPGPPAGDTEVSVWLHHQSLLLKPAHFQKLPLDFQLHLWNQLPAVCATAPTPLLSIPDFWTLPLWSL